MAQDPTALELAVTRALRDNIVTLQRSADELQQAFADVVASCSSSRPTNSLPSILRAQTAAASLAASLEVLARFVTSSSQVAPAGVTEAVARAVSIPVPEPAPAPMPVAPPPPPPVPPPMAEAPAPVEMPVAPPPPPEQRVGTGTAHEMPREVGMDTIRSYRDEPVPEVAAQAAAPPPPPPPMEAPAFDVQSLSADEQEMHRRANRHIKVSMQDIKLLRKDAIKQGREQKDLCLRLKDDLDKARKEYERRFKPILGHPVDYFYKWAVEILADGNAEALGEYPYPSPVAKR
ncbi:MAG: hypothetical protein M1451_06990 [Acidobacteria bacterium]|nr:hypothetical protein [Acidobacteriota bacterium]